LTGKIVARRYAKALFALAEKAGGEAPARFGADLEAFAAVLEVSPDLLRFFANPVIGDEVKRSVLAELVTKLSPSHLVANFLSLVIEKGRVSAVSDIAALYRALLDETNGILRGQLVTSFALSETRQDQIKTTLEKQSGKTMELSFVVDPALLGGVLLKIGDKVLDASLRAQLAILKEQIKRGE